MTKSHFSTSDGSVLDVVDVHPSWGPGNEHQIADNFFVILDSQAYYYHEDRGIRRTTIIGLYHQVKTQSQFYGTVLAIFFYVTFLLIGVAFEATFREHTSYDFALLQCEDTRETTFLVNKTIGLSLRIDGEAIIDIADDYFILFVCSFFFIFIFIFDQPLVDHFVSCVWRQIFFHFLKKCS